MSNKYIKDERRKPMYGYESRYLISDYGRVKSLWVFDNRFIRLRLSDKGYWCFNARNGDGTKGCTKYVHSAVLETFGSPRPKGLFCLHGDDNSQNNHIGNLRWGTQKENMVDSKNNGRIFGYKGSLHPLSKLSDTDVKAIRKILNPVKTKSYVAIGKIYGVHEATISAIHKRKIWKHI